MHDPYRILYDSHTTRAGAYRLRLQPLRNLVPFVCGPCGLLHDSCTGSIGTYANRIQPVWDLMRFVPIRTWFGSARLGVASSSHRPCLGPVRGPSWPLCFHGWPKPPHRFREQGLTQGVLGSRGAPWRALWGQIEHHGGGSWGQGKHHGGAPGVPH